MFRDFKLQKEQSYNLFFWSLLRIISSTNHKSWSPETCHYPTLVASLTHLSEPRSLFPVGVGISAKVSHAQQNFNKKFLNKYQTSHSKSRYVGGNEKNWFSTPDSFYARSYVIKSRSVWSRFMKRWGYEKYKTLNFS